MQDTQIQNTCKKYKQDLHTNIKSQGIWLGIVYNSYVAEDAIDADIPVDDDDHHHN